MGQFVESLERRSLLSGTAAAPVGVEHDVAAAIGTTTIPAAPAAELVAAKVTAKRVVRGGPGYTFKGVFTFNGRVRADAVAPLAVEGPGGFLREPEVLKAKLTKDGTRVTSTYFLMAPGTVFDPKDDGLYRIVWADTSAARAGGDTHAHAGAPLATFTVKAREPRVRPTEPGIITGYSASGSTDLNVRVTTQDILNLLGGGKVDQTLDASTQISELGAAGPQFVFDANNQAASSTGGTGLRYDGILIAELLADPVTPDRG